MRMRLNRQDYPPQFWLLFVGMLVSLMGSSMIWPFLMIYISEQLVLPLAAVTSLMTLESIMGLIASLIAGPITDRAGRKWIMVISLAISGLGYLMMAGAHSFAAFAALMALRGAFNPLYQVGANAMLADMLPPEKRDDGYALLRMASNLGLALGPAVGGFIANSSYTTAFVLGASGFATFSLLLTLFARETLPEKPSRLQRTAEPLGGYQAVLRDRKFMLFILAFTLIMVSSSMIWVLLAVYAKQNFQVTESQYGLIPTTNALMVILLQMAITRRTKTRPPLAVMTLGALLYGAGVGSVALGNTFWAFWGSMVLVTCGELILVPTATTYAANLAPADKRGRYMSLFSLTWGTAASIGPLLGGALNDMLFPRAIWYGGGVFGILSTLVFLMLATGKIGDKRSGRPGTV